MKFGISKLSGRLLVAGLLCALGGSTAKAQTENWYSPLGTGNGTGTAYNWQENAVPPSGNATNLNFALYDQLGYSVAVNSPTTVNFLNFSNFAGGAAASTLSFAGSALTLDATSSNNAFIANASSGTVSIANALAFGSTNPALSLVFNGSGTGTVAIAGTITGTASNTLAIATNPLGVTSFAADSSATFAGTTVLTSGVLSLGNVNAIGSSAANSLTLNGANSLLLSNLAGTGTFANNINLGSFTLNVGNLSGPTPTFGGIIAGTGGVTLRGGQGALSTGNTFSGPVTVLGGSLSILGPVASGPASGVLGSGTGALTLGGSFGSGGRGTATYTGTGATILTVGSELFFNNTSATSFSLPLTVQAGSALGTGIYVNSANPVVFSGDVGLGNKLYISSFDKASNRVTINGVISGIGSLTVTSIATGAATGAVNLTNGANSYSGGTYIANGGTVVPVTGSLGTGPIIFTQSSKGGGIAASSTLVLNNPVILGNIDSFAAFSAPGNFTLNGPVGGTGVMFLSVGSGTLFLTNAVNYVGSLSELAADASTRTVDIGSTTLNIGAPGASFTGTSFGYAGTLAGAGGTVNKLGSSITEFSNVVNIGGPFNINGGTISLFSRTGQGSLAASGATVNVGGTNSAAGTAAATLSLDYTGSATANHLADAMPLYLNGGILSVVNNATVGSNFAEAAGTLSVSGFGIVSYANSAGGGGTLNFANSLTRTAGQGGTLLVRGPSLGTAAGVFSQVNFFTAPGLSGNPVGTLTNVPILPYVIADGVGGAGNTFASYGIGGATGITPLNTATNYQPNALAGATGTTNVRFTATQPSLQAGTAIQSLVVDSPAAAGTVLTGTATTLTVGSAGASNTAAILFSNTGTGLVTGFSAIDFGGREGIVYATGGSAIVDSVIQNTGAAGLTKSGNGTLFLTQGNTYSGGTVIGAGSVYVTNDIQLGTAGAAVTLAGGSLQWATGTALTRPLIVGDGGGSLNVLAGSSLTLSGISGTGAFIKSGTGNLTLAGTNTYTGRTVVSAGVLSFASESVLGPNPLLVLEGVFGATLQTTAATVTKDLLVNGSGVIDIPTGTTSNFTGIIEGGTYSTTGVNVTLAKTGGGNLVLSAVEPLAGPLAVLNGTVTLSGQGSLPVSFGTPLSGSVGGVSTTSSHGVYIHNNATVVLDNSGTNNLDRWNDLQGVRLHGGNLVFIGNASATSTELINTVLVQDGTFNTITVTPGAGQYAALGFAGISPVIGNNTLTGASGMVLFRGTNLGAVPTAGSTTAGIVFGEKPVVGAVTFPSVAGTTSLYGGGQLVGGAGAPGSTNISILPYGVGDTSAAGLGSSFVTYEGTLTTNVGIRPLAVSEYAGTIASANNFSVLSSNNVLLAAAANLNGPATVNALNLSGSNATVTGGPLTLTAGAIIANGGTGSGGLANSAVNFGANTAYFFVNDTLNATASIIGAAQNNTYGLVKGGTGNLLLNGVNAFNSGISIGQGTLTVGSQAAVSPVALYQVTTGGTLNTTGDLRIGALTAQLLGVVSALPLGGGTVNLAAGSTLTLLNTASATFAGSIAGTNANLVRTALTTGGTQTFWGTSTYSGTTTITNGAINLSGGSSLLPNTSGININGGTLGFSFADANSTSNFSTTPKFSPVIPFALAGVVSYTGNANANSTATIGATASGLNFQGGSTITLNGGALSTTTLVVGDTALGAINRTNSATLLVRGTNLATPLLAAPAGSPIVNGIFPNTTNVYFSTAPSSANFIGGGGALGTTTISIIPWMSGDVAPAGLGTTFVTYDPIVGIRPLNLTAALGAVEYTDSTAVSVGSTTANNVRISGATPLALSGIGTTTINSLLIGTAATAGVTTTVGTPTLLVTSGAILDSSTTAVTLSPVSLAFGAAGTGEAIVTTVTGASATLSTLINAGSLTKGGPGTLVLNATFGLAFTGGIAITNGTLSVGSDAQLGPTTGSNFGRLLFSGPYGSPTLTYTGTVLPAISRDVVIATGSATFNYGGAADLLLSGSLLSTNKAISGAGAFIKAGAGRIILADNDNTGAGGFTGQVRIDAGTLRFAHDFNLGAGGDVILNGGTLELANGATWNTSRPVYVTLASTLQLNGGSANLSGSFSGTTSGTLTLSNSGASSSTLLLSGSNTFNNSIAVGAGVTLTAASNTALGLFAQNVSVASGGALELQGGIQIGPKPIAIAGTGNSFSPNGALRNVNGANSLLGPVTLSAASTIQIASGRLDLYGALAGSFPLSVTGSGTLNLANPTGNAGFTGATTVASGATLLVNNQSGLGANGVTVASGATIGGAGAVSSIVVNANGILSPGNSPGTLTVSAASNAITLNSGAIYSLEVNNATGSAGTNWDLLRVTNNAGNSIALPASMTIQLKGLNASNVIGAVPNFVNTVGYSWEFLQSSGGFTNFNPANFTIDTTAFTSFNALAGSFGIVQANGGLALDLVYSPVPEPAGILLIGCALMGIAVRRNRRRSSVV